LRSAGTKEETVPAERSALALRSQHLARRLTVVINK
jgi:hypothetical protein